MNQAFVDYFRCPEQYADMGLSIREMNGGNSGYFRFGTHLCYGGASVVSPASIIDETLHDVLPQVVIEGSTCVLPFDLTDVVTNLVRNGTWRHRPHLRCGKLLCKARTTWHDRAYRSGPSARSAVLASRLGPQVFSSVARRLHSGPLLEQTMALLLQSSGVEQVPLSGSGPKENQVAQSSHMMWKSSQGFTSVQL